MKPVPKSQISAPSSLPAPDHAGGQAGELRTPSSEFGTGGRDNLKSVAEQYGHDFLEAVSGDILEPELIAKVPVEWALLNCLLPVVIDGDTCVLTSEPDKITSQDDLALLIGRELRPVLASREVIAHGIEQCYFSKDDSPREFIRDLGIKHDTEEVAAKRSDDLLRVAEKAPVTQLVNLVLLEAVKQRASDVHFEPFESMLKIRYRIDGILYEQASPPRNLSEALISRLKVMARMILQRNACRRTAWPGCG